MSTHALITLKRILSFFSLFFICNAFGAKTPQSGQQFGISYEMMASNFGEYTASSIFSKNDGRNRIIEYQGGQEFLMGGFYRFGWGERGEEKAVQVRLAHTLSGNTSGMNSNFETNFNQTKSYRAALIFNLPKWTFNVQYDSLSLGKVKLIDTSADSEGTTGTTLGTTNLVTHNFKAAGFYRFKGFPFLIGLGLYRSTAPRIVYTYRAARLQGDGPLKPIDFRAAKVTMELGLGPLSETYVESGIRWHMGFAMGLAQYKFFDYQQQLTEESSSAYTIRFGFGYLWSLNEMFKDTFDQAYFIGIANEYTLQTYDNNDENSQNLTEVVHRTSGADELFNVTVSLGLRI